MHVTAPHEWNVSTEEAQEIQYKLRKKLITETTFTEVHTVAGVDVGFPRAGGGEIARAAIVVLDFPTLQPVDYNVAEMPVEMPYIPGYLSFREGPAVLAALEKLSTTPDLFIFDGQGIAHPRGLGIAAHLGIIMDMPAIGCAKSRLYGTHEMPAAEKGSIAPLYANGAIIGNILRTRTDVKPVYVSIGHRIDLKTATDYVLRCCIKYKLPETTRYADKVAGGAKIVIKPRASNTIVRTYATSGYFLPPSTPRAQSF